jgi:hypothetical protein
MDLTLGDCERKKEGKNWKLGFGDWRNGCDGVPFQNFLQSYFVGVIEM